jgi:hypothetical protein
VGNFIRRAVSVFIAATLALGAQVVAPTFLPNRALASASADNLLPGLVPTAYVSSYSSDNGFVIRLDNYDPAYAWTFGTSQGSLTTRAPSGSTTWFSIAVRSIPLDGSATVTITTSRSGYADASVSVVGYAKKTGLTPLFGTVAPEVGGYTVQVTNFSSNYSWVAASPYGSASIDDRGLVTVIGLGDHLSDILWVTSSKADSTSVTVSITATALPLNAALVPSFGEPTFTETSVEVQIENYDPAFTWSQSTNGEGTVTISESGLVTISDLYGGQPVTLTVSNSLYGYQPGEATINLTSLYSSLVPDYYYVNSTSDGFVLQLFNYNENYQWNITSDAGSVSLDSAGEITVTGLEPGQTAQLVISTSRDHANPTSTTASFQAINATFTPTLANPTRLEHGFTVQITNYDPSFAWSVYTESAIGHATLSDSGLITVSDLEDGQEAIIHVAASRVRFFDSDVSTTSSSLLHALVPDSALPTQTTSGFTVQITNFDSSFTWQLSATAGSASISSSGLITVSGLAAGTSATVTVTSSRTGSINGVSTIAGRALVAPAQISQDSTESSDSTDAGDGDIDLASRAQAESVAREEAEARAAAKARELVEAVIRQKEQEKAEAAAKAAQVATAKLAEDLKAVSALVQTKPLAMAKALASLTGDQVALIPTSTFKRLSTLALAAIGATQAAGITSGQLRSLTIGSLKNLSPAAIGSLKPEALGSLSVAKLKALTKAQVKQIWAAQLLQLDPDQRKAIKR